MNWDAIGAIGEVIGAAGVIGSLLYLAVQIRGDAKAKRAVVMHDQSAAYRNFLKTFSTDESLGEIYLRGINDFSSVEGVELVRFTSALGFLFRVIDEAHFQWREGNLDEELWHGFASPLTDMLAYPGVQQWWPTRAHWYSESFREFVESKLGQLGSPSMYGESDSAH